MSDTLCLYCTRTKHTKAIMEDIAEALGADLARITDGVDRHGLLGYAGAGFSAIRKELPELLSVHSPRLVSEYRTIILGAPVWAETVCPLAKAFLVRYAPIIRARMYYVITHMSDRPYEEQIARLDGYLGERHAAHLSLSTGDGGYAAELRDFIALVSDAQRKDAESGGEA